METTENNRLIAEFMGFEWMSEEDFLSYNYPEGKDLKNVMIDVAAQKYQTSWDWLIPVVEKIENENHGCVLVVIEDERCHIDSQNGFEIDSVGSSKIEATYNAVLEFIKLYNKNLVG
jgi:hypothetical protein